MGLLDDAIRQHLELKRRHGADPGDVAKLEHEAFGPVEREDALAVPGPQEGSIVAFDHEAANATVAREEEASYEEAELEADDAWATAHPTQEAPEVVRAEPAPPGGGSVQFDPSAPAVEPEAAAAAHDELEQTPEFLQETPEHDRLWFEQKPPRDFDF